MHNLNSITFSQNRLCPFVSPDYLLIEFDGKSRRSQGEIVDQIRQGASLLDLATLTVDLHQQGLNSHSGGFRREDDPPEFGSQAIDLCLHENGRPAGLE